MDIIAALKSCSIFRDLDDRNLQRLAEGIQERTYRNGDVVFLEGATYDHGLFVIAGGEVVITTELADAAPGDDRPDDFFLTSFSQGDLFGEISLLDGGPRTARAEARGDTTLLFIPAPFVHMLAQRDPKTGYIIMRNIGATIAKRLREMDYAIKNKAFLG